MPVFLLQAIRRQGEETSLGALRTTERRNKPESRALLDSSENEKWELTFVVSSFGHLFWVVERSPVWVFTFPACAALGLLPFRKPVLVSLPVTFYRALSGQERSVTDNRIELSSLSWEAGPG